MFKRAIASTRFLILVPVLGSALAATTLLIYGGIEAVQVVSGIVAEGEVTRKGAKALAIEFIEIVDLFLLGTVFYIVALGLYELFIEPNIGMPAWLEIRTLDDLKNKLVKVVIVVLGVLFLGHVVSWDGERDLLPLGAAIALVVAALTWFLTAKTEKRGSFSPGIKRRSRAGRAPDRPGGLALWSVALPVQPEQQPGGHKAHRSSVAAPYPGQALARRF